MPAMIDSSDYSTVVWCTECPWFSAGALGRVEAEDKRDAHNQHQEHKAPQRSRRTQVTGPEATAVRQATKERVIAESIRLGRYCACGRPAQYIARRECHKCMARRRHQATKGTS